MLCMEKNNGSQFLIYIYSKTKSLKKVLNVGF